MKAQPLKVQEKWNFIQCEINEATHIRLIFPVNFVPLRDRLIPVITQGKRSGTPCWTWNGDTEKPTLRPSILTRWQGVDDNIICHSFVNDGIVQFLSDCTHELAGQSIPLLDITNRIAKTND